jgi:hypothetical protein
VRQLSIEQLETYERQRASADKLRTLNEAQAQAAVQTQLTNSRVQVQIADNGKEAAKGQVTEENANVLQQLGLKDHVRAGPDEVTVEVRGDTMLYQAVGRHSEPHRAGPQQNPVPEAVMDYDRTSLSTADALRARVTVKHNGKGPTYMVIAVLGPSSSAPTPPPATRRRPSSPPRRGRPSRPTPSPGGQRLPRQAARPDRAGRPRPPPLAGLPDH